MSHFRISGPAIVSFSGGRTSAYMLARIIEAHGGALPGDIHVVFSNTGREMPATLDFVAECASRWNVRVRWLEYTAELPHWTEVNHNSAARSGEPFAALIDRRNFVPNPVMRFCTQELKIRPMRSFARSLGWDRWINVVGLRADEIWRVFRAQAGAERERWSIAAPLASAGVRKREVLEWWAAQPFDLRLAGPHEGNCDGCFLKSRAKIMRMLRDHPDRMVWWQQQEQQQRGLTKTVDAAFFRADRESYARLAEIARDQGVLDLGDEEDHDAECGVACAA